MQICRAILKGSLMGTVQTRNMFEAQFPLASVVDADIQAAMVSWVASIFSPVLTYISNLWVMESVQVQQYITGSWQDVAEVPVTTPGGATADMMEFQTAVLLIGRTGGLKVIGKKFLAGLATSVALHGSLNAAALVLFASALAAYITPFISGAGKVGNPGVLDKRGVFWEFLGGNVGSILSTMRRRKPGYGI